MIDVELICRTIRNVYQAMSGKSENDVILSFEPSLGVTKPWKAKIDVREARHEEYEGALIGLLAILKKELADKVKYTETEAKRLQRVLYRLGN